MLFFQQKSTRSKSANPLSHRYLGINQWQTKLRFFRLQGLGVLLPVSEAKKKKTTGDWDPSLKTKLLHSSWQRYPPLPIPQTLAKKYHHGDTLFEEPKMLRRFAFRYDPFRLLGSGCLVLVLVACQKTNKDFPSETKMRLPSQLDLRKQKCALLKSTTRSSCCKVIALSWRFLASGDGGWPKRVEPWKPHKIHRNSRNFIGRSKS